MARRPDPIFADPRLARIYDDVDGSRDDLDHYVDIIDELRAGSVLDVGCGTGVLACRLALAGIEVTGVDPARASLNVARSKPGSDAVTWIHGDAASFSADLPRADVQPFDLAVMTGNVAQVFTVDEDWLATLRGIARALRPGGHLVFETRNPAKRGWEAWDTSGETTVVATAHGAVATWMTLLDVSEPLVTFCRHYRFAGSGEVIGSDSTLRFRSLDEITTSLGAAGFTVEEVRDAPDRPGLEFVVLARSSAVGV